MRTDDGGMFWDIFFDVVSLCVSVVDVIKNPDDPWAWGGLVADVVSVVVPFATGGGLIVKAASKVDDVVDVVKAVDKVDDVVDAVRAVDNVAEAVDTASDIGKVANKMDDAADFAGDLSKNVCNNGACFVEGTLIETEYGSVRIEDIKVGTLVYAHNPDTGETELKKVVDTFVKRTYQLIHIEVNGEEITTTPEHPFWVPQKGWTDAISLRAGDRLQLLNGEYVIIEQVQHEILENPITVYNFEVEDFHTYYITNSEILVHNADCKFDAIVDKCTMSTDEVLDTAIDYLGPGYKEASPGRFVSADGARQVRIMDDDLLGKHAGGPHVNFELLSPKHRTKHIYFID